MLEDPGRGALPEMLSARDGQGWGSTVVLLTMQLAEPMVPLSSMTFSDITPTGPHRNLQPFTESPRPP